MLEAGGKPVVAFYNSMFTAVSSQEELGEVQRLLQGQAQHGCKQQWQREKERGKTRGRGGKREKGKGSGGGVCEIGV